MTDLEELLKRPRAFRILFALAQKEPMNMRAFLEASRQARPDAKALREEMEALGLLTIKELSGHGNAGILEIRLSKLGRELADHLVAMDEALRDQRGRK